MSAVLTAAEPGARHLATVAAVPPPLVAQFYLLATAPGGVARLRELILTLAVQGKLVPQQAGDEPASVLLGRIRAEKDRLVAAGKLRADRTCVAIAERECPFGLPPSWVWVRFGEASINRDGERIPVASSERDGRAKVYDYYGASGVIDKIDGYLFDKALLLIGEDGANLLNRSTPIAFLAKGKYWVNNHAHAIDTTEPGLMPYLAMFINATSLEPYVTHTAQPKMNQAKLNSIVVPLPPTAEQARIVARVEELMRLCDALDTQGQLAVAQHAQLLGVLLGTLTDSASPEALVEHRHRVAAHFDLLLDRPEAVDALEQTILQLAVRGLLVPQDPKDEPASVLLAQIRGEKDRLAASGKGKRDRPGVQLFDEVADLPMGWTSAPLGDITEISDVVTLGRKGSISQPVTLPYLRVANVQRWHLAMHALKEVTISAAELPRFALPDGDLLITEGGDWDKVGRTAIWRDELAQCLHQNHVFKARSMLTSWNAEWARLILNSSVARAYFASCAKQTTNLASINMTQLKACPFPLPPFAEQSRIVASVAQLRQLCTDLRQRLAARQATQAQLAQALVESAAG